MYIRVERLEPRVRSVAILYKVSMLGALGSGRCSPNLALESSLGILQSVQSINRRLQ